MSELSHLSLFSGIGGIDLAAEWAGFRSVGQVERDPYCRQVLQKNFQNTYIWNDIHDLTIDTFREHCGEQSPILLSGGFPCQPFSVAGKRKSAADDRYLWPEMFRVVQELRPSWVLGENVPGLIPLALDQVLSDLESAGYSCRTFLIPACGVGALHKRDRCFIVANSSRELSHGRRDARHRGYESANSSRADVSNTNNERCKEYNTPTLTGESGFHTRASDSRGQQWEIESGICGVADGISSRVDRLRALGNAVVPQQVYPILQGIANIENETSTGGM